MKPANLAATRIREAYTPYCLAFELTKCSAFYARLTKWPRSRQTSTEVAQRSFS